MVESNEEHRPDDLEITSIGSLYKGPWDKKYWSSSRGKDRYPYPVGYLAVRAHNGSSHKMEIREGPKGPLFVITAGDGRHCSGQTPDIAWDNFQKKSFSRNGHGKRLSCKIDGVEFFGFKNPLVQRLLRELVANVNGTAESKAEITRKRSKRGERINTKSSGKASLKKPRPQDLLDNVGTSNSFQGALQSTVHSKLVVQEENSYPLAEDGSLLTSVDFCGHPGEKAVPAQEESSEISKASRAANNSPSEEKSLHRSQEADVGGFSVEMEIEDKNDAVPVAKDSLGINDVDLCAPDTLDFTQDNASEYDPSTWNKRICSMDNVKEGITASCKIVSEDLITESHPEEEMRAPNSTESSEKNDFDSVGDEMAKSMMTLLLPQAIPLLKKVSRKKKATIDTSEIMPSHVNSQEAMNGTGYFVDFPSSSCGLTENAQVQKETEIQIRSTDLGSATQSFVDTKFVVPDSFEDAQCGGLVNNQVRPDIVEHEGIFGRDSSSQNSQLASYMQRVESPICQVEANGSKDILCYNDADVDLNEKPEEGHGYKPESILGRSSACKEVSSEVKDVCSSLDKKAVGAEFHPNEKCINTAPDCTQEMKTSDARVRGILSSLPVSKKEISAKSENAESYNMSLSQVPPMVYTRKKSSKRISSTQNYDCPLSESIICRSSGDGTSTGNLLASGVNQMKSDGIPCKKGLLSIEAKLGRNSQGLNKEILNNKGQGLLQNHALVCSSKDEDTSDLINPSALLVEKSQDHFVPEVVGQKNQEELQCSLLSQKQGTSFDENASDTKEVEARSDIKCYTNMELGNKLEGVVELVGRYLHPLPVTSLLVSARGHDVYICVLCGLLVDEERTLLMYRVEIKEPVVGCPSLVGHTPVSVQVPKYHFGGEIAVGTSSFQFTPDGLCLVLLDILKAPYCREGRIHCLCSTCTSSCCEEDSVKIVQVKLGYVSVVTKFRTCEGVQCILVCEPNHLIAVGESGRLHLWVMNSTWSAQIEEFVIPANDSVSPCIVELKRIPNCAPLVVGHNGFGEFSIWDISQRILLSRFSSPGSSVYQFIPISVFSWQRKCPFLNHSDMDEHIDRIMGTTKTWSLDHKENDSFLPSDGEDIAVWILVSTDPDTDAQYNCTSNGCQKNPVGWWRLALLVKDSVILGSALDPRAAAIGALTGQGIIGTCDGLVYMWELATGTKLVTLHDFKGSSVSCIATDDSTPGVLAVADNRGQLLVYTCSQKNT